MEVTNYDAKKTHGGACQKILVQNNSTLFMIKSVPPERLIGEVIGHRLAVSLGFLIPPIKGFGRIEDILGEGELKKTRMKETHYTQIEYWHNLTVKKKMEQGDPRQEMLRNHEAAVFTLDWILSNKDRNQGSLALTSDNELVLIDFDRSKPWGRKNSSKRTKEFCQETIKKFTSLEEEDIIKICTIECDLPSPAQTKIKQAMRRLENLRIGVDDELQRRPEDGRNQRKKARKVER